MRLSMKIESFKTKWNDLPGGRLTIVESDCEMPGWIS